MTTEAQTPTPATDPHAEHEHDDAKRTLADSFAEVGLAWARYGISVGRVALEASARGLETTARALGDLADSFERRHPPSSDNRDGGQHS